MDWGLWLIIWLLGGLVGSGIGMMVTMSIMDKQRGMREVALRKIVRHQWGAGANDAISITRIALEGLDEE